MGLFGWVESSPNFPRMSNIRHMGFSSNNGLLFGVAFEDTTADEGRPTIHIFRAEDLTSGKPPQPLSSLNGHLASISGFSFSPK